MKVLIAGDFCPINRAEKILSSGQSLFSDSLLQYWNSADFRIANLEAPICTVDTKIKKSGPHLKASPEIAAGISKLNFTALSLANNHIMDYGRPGFEQTCETLDGLGINYFGVEKNATPIAAQILEKDGMRLAILSYSIAEFCLAEDFEGNGARGIDLIKILEDINRIRKEVDHFVILLHMGLYLLPLPSPRQQQLCRFLARQGASAVLCQHSHVCGATEIVDDCFISYGQGSFLFDLNKKNSHWNEGYLVEMVFGSGVPQVLIKGTLQFNDKQEVDLMDAGRQQKLMHSLGGYTEALKDQKQIALSFRRAALKNRNSYYGMMLAPSGRLLNAVKRRINLGSLMPDTMKTVLLNLYRNEEHSELVQEILKSDLNE